MVEIVIFSPLVDSTLVYVFRKEEKQAALLVYTSFGLVATSMVPRSSFFTSSDSQVSQAKRKVGMITD